MKSAGTGGREEAREGSNEEDGMAKKRDDIYINSNIAFTSQDLTRLMIQSLYNLGYRWLSLFSVSSSFSVTR